MFNALALISLSAAFFLLILLVVSNMRDRKAYLQRMEGARAMVKRTKKVRARREEKFKEISTLSEIDENKTESLWLSELEFYQNIGETICAPTEKSIKKVTTLVTKLLKPYYELLDELATAEPVEELSDELTDVIDSAEQATNTSSDEFQVLEKRYKEKIEENKKLQKQIDILKQSPHTTPEEKKAQPEPTPDSSAAGDPNLMELLNQVMADLSHQAEMTPPTATDDIEELKVSYQAILLRLENKLNAFDAVEDEFDQTEALIEQLRYEKVDYLKKYKRSMHLLFNTYKEYAGAFGLDAPQNPDIEIDAFEKFIEDS